MWIYYQIFLLFFWNVPGYLSQNPADCTPKAGVPCLRYSFNDGDCSESYLYGRFGSMYLRSNLTFPGMPENFTAYSRWKKHPANDLFYPELNITFAGPLDAAASFVLGFEVVRYELDSNSLKCYIFDVSSVNWDMSTVGTEFFLNLFPLPKDKLTYIFELYLLPKYQHRGPQFDEYRQLYVNIPPKVVDPNSDLAKDWRASMFLTFGNKTGTINVTVSNFPTQHGFEKLTYWLWRSSGTGMDQVEEQESAEAYHVFRNVPSGHYVVWVQPVDPHFMTVNQCLCKAGSQCDQCITTETQKFYFHYTGPPPTSAPTTTTPKITTPVPTEPVTDPATSGSPPLGTGTPTGGENDKEDVSDVKIALAVIGGVLGVVIATVLVFILTMRCRNGEGSLRNLFAKNDKKPHAADDDADSRVARLGPEENKGYDNISIFTYHTVVPNNVEKIKFEKQPRVFLLYENDHQCHKKVVETFATYLQQHCQCKVMCAEWQLDDSWVHQDLQQADVTVVVNSEGAYKNYMSVFSRGKFGGDHEHSPSSARRLSSINSIRNKFQEEHSYDKVVMVYFDYTNEQYILPDICPGYKYKLMKHFTDFLMHVHQLHRADDLSKYDLPLDGNHMQRPTGQQLLQAIAEAAKFEREDPRWSMKKFDRMYSSTSDDSRYDSGIQGDCGSTSQTPSGENMEAWKFPQHKHPSSSPDKLQEYLLKRLDGRSDAITINPSQLDIEIQQQAPNIPTKIPTSNPKSRPALAIYTDIQATSASEPEHPYQSPEDFVPPDDFDNFDVTSKTLSEQMQNICDNYKKNTHQDHGTNAGHEVRGDSDAKTYDRNEDLYFLRVQSGELPFISADCISLGGESV